MIAAQYPSNIYGIRLADLSNLNSRMNLFM